MVAMYLTTSYVSTPRQGSAAPRPRDVFVVADSRVLDLLSRARGLMVEAEGLASDEAFETIYRAAHRALEAAIALREQPRKRRRRKPDTTWQRARVAAPELLPLIEPLETYTGLRARVQSGLVRVVEAADVARLRELTELLISQVDDLAHSMPAVA